MGFFRILYFFSTWVFIKVKFHRPTPPPPHLSPEEGDPGL